MLNEFYKRINLNTELKNISERICQLYKIGDYIKDEVILIGYEDFNYILTTSKAQYCVKIFNKDRTMEEIRSYITRIKMVSNLDINTPKPLQVSNIYLQIIEFNNIQYRVCVFEHIDGKSFYELKAMPSDDEIKSIVQQMSKIHNLKLKPEFIYDPCTITNFQKEYDSKKKYLDSKYSKLFSELSMRFKNIELDKLPQCFIHGDIIKSNIMKDTNGSVWIIDFASSNYLPRIVDLAVAACDLCLNSNNKEDTIRKTHLMLSEYQKYAKLTEYELEVFPLLYDLANAIGILQICYLNNFAPISEEDKFWLKESEKGLNFSDLDFWNSIL